MKREKRLTKRERKALDGPAQPKKDAPHIHCVACGRHIDPSEFTKSPVNANWIRCAHGTKYASCTGCVEGARVRLATHDRTGKPVEVAPAWH